MFSFFKRRIKESQAINEEINRGREVLERIQADKTVLETELQHIREEKSNFIKEIEKLKQEYDASNNTIEAIRDELKEIELDRDKLLIEQHEFEAINSKLCAAREQLRCDLEEKEEKLQKCEEERKKQAQVTLELENREQELKKETNKLEEEKQELSCQSNKLQEDNERLGESKYILEEKISQLQIKVDSLEVQNKSLEESKCNLEAITYKLQEEKGVLQEGKQILEQRTNELQKVNEVLEKSKQNLEEDKESLEQKTSQLQEETKRLEKAKENLEQKASQLQEENKSLEETKQSLEQKTNELEEETRRLEESKQSLEQRTSQLQEENKSLEETKQSLEQKANELEEETRRLEESKQSLEQRASQLQEENKSLEETKQSLEQKTNELEEETRRLEESKQSLEQRTSQLQEENKSLEETKQSLEQKANELEEETRRLEESKQSLEQRTSQLQGENKSLEETKQSLEQKTNELEEETRRLEESKQSLEQRTSQLQEVNEGVQENKQHLEQGISLLQIETNNLQQQRGNLREAIKQDEEIGQQLKNKLEYLKIEIDSLTKHKHQIADGVAKEDVEDESKLLTEQVNHIGTVTSEQKIQEEDIEEVVEEKQSVDESNQLLEELINSIFEDQEDEYDMENITDAKEIIKSDLQKLETPQKVLSEQEPVKEEVNPEKEPEWMYDLQDQDCSEEKVLDKSEGTEKKVAAYLSIQDKSLGDIELELENLFRKVNLIGDIYLTKLDYEYLKQSLKENTKDISGTSLKIKYGNCIALFMVYTAIYYYDNSYWEYVEKYFVKVDRTTLMKIFMGVLNRFKLSQFEQYESALKNVTPILCHSGIPHKCMHGLLQVIEELGNRGEGVLIGREAFKELLNDRVDKPVTRYIDYLGNEWETFLLECEEAMQSDKVKEYEILMSHMAYFIDTWKSNQDSVTREKRTKILMPRVCIDPEGIGVYVLLPEQKFYEENIETVNWYLVNEASKEKMVEAELHYNGVYYFTKEIHIPLKETSSLEVRLDINEMSYRIWHINHLDENFIAFNEIGELVGKDISGQKEHIVLLKKTHNIKNPKVILESLDELPQWPSYKGYRVNIQDIAYINYGKLGYMTETIHVKKNIKPVLAGGQRLFEDDSAQTIINYVKLPELIIYDIAPRNEWNRLRIVVQSEELIKEQTLEDIKQKIHLRENAICISLVGEELIPEKCFGHYEVKLYKDKKIMGKVQLAYVPNVQVAPYPQPNKNGIYYKFRVHERCQLEFEESELSAQRAVLLSQDMLQVWRFNGTGQIAGGKLIYNSPSGRIINFRIEKQIRPISWGILQLSNLNTFKWSNKINTISLENLKNHTDYYLVVEGEEVLKSERLNLILENANKEIIKYVNGLRRKEKASRMRIHLAEFIDILEGQITDDCVLKLQCYYGGNKVEYPIIRFQEKLVLSNLKCAVGQEVLEFRWEQEGGLNQREIMLYSIDRPWEKPIIKIIPDGECRVRFTQSEIYQGKYSLLVRYKKDEWGFEEEEEDYQLSKLPVINLNKGKQYEGTTTIEKEIYRIINSPGVFMKKVLTPQTDKEELNKVFKTIIVVGENRTCYENNMIEKLIEASEAVVLRNLESYFRFILSIQLPYERFVYYCTAFNIYNNLLIKGIDLNTSELQKLWQVNPMLGVLISLQMKEIDKEYAMDKILNYIGKEGIRNLLAHRFNGDACNEDISIDGQRHSFEECLKLSLWQECYCEKIRPTLSQALIGDKEEIRNYYGHSASTWEVAMSRKRSARIQSQQILMENKESIFLGKTYLQVVMEMRKQNTQYIKQVSEKVHQVLGIRLSAIKEFMQTNNHKKVLNLLVQRIEEGQQAEYWCGIIAYLQACESLGIKENIFTPYQSQELTSILSEQMQDLYERDRVLFQIYLIMEE